MINETLKQLEKSIAGNHQLGEADKGELRQLLLKLKGEVGVIEDAHGADTKEHGEGPKLEEPTSKSVDRLSGTIEKIEATHPELAKTVNEFCTRLSSLGI